MEIIFFLLLLLVLLGPLSYLFGADSRVEGEHDRGWWPGASRPRS